MNLAHLPRRRARAERGFTLIELMITVAIVGILAAIAYPSYTEQVAKGRRSQAKAQLVAGQLWMERFYSENYRYDTNSAGTPVTDASQFAGRFSTSPPAGEGRAMYTLGFNPQPARDSYTIRATRTGSMLGDRCGELTIDNVGRKSIAPDTYGGQFATLVDAIAYCWN